MVSLALGFTLPNNTSANPLPPCSPGYQAIKTEDTFGNQFLISIALPAIIVTTVFLLILAISLIKFS